MGYQPLARDGRRLHSGRAQTILGWGGRQEGLLHTALEPSVKPGVDAPQNHGGVRGWARVGDSSARGLLRAGAEGFRREEVRQEPTQTAGDGGRAQFTWLKPLDCGESSVVGRVDVDADRCAEVQVLALPLGCEDGSGDALQRPQGQAPGCAHKSRCPRMFLSHEQHPPCAPEQKTSMGSPALGRGT